jgi:hypothetical protein
MGERVFWAVNFAVMAAMIVAAGMAVAYVLGVLGSPS